MTESAACRAGTPGDAIDGVVPARVVEPDSAVELAAALADATSSGHSTIVRGGGTKLDWGRRPAVVDQILSTARLVSPLLHRDGDLTATVGSGVRLADLNDHLGRKGQWLPVESPFPGATIGGLVATNESGPFRHRFGTPRDLLIGVTLALPDGRLVKSGGTVVKNVAGYDLGRLISGSMGSLAVIVDATFKLAPCAAIVGDAAHPLRHGDGDGRRVRHRDVEPDRARRVRSARRAHARPRRHSRDAGGFCVEPACDRHPGDGARSDAARRDRAQRQ